MRLIACYAEHPRADLRGVAQATNVPADTQQCPGHGIARILIMMKFCISCRKQRPSDPKNEPIQRLLVSAASAAGKEIFVVLAFRRVHFYRIDPPGRNFGWKNFDAVVSSTSDFYTRITDAELVEHRYPVRIERFAVRRGSGGAGRHFGGDGVVRETVFLEPMSLSVLTQHRVTGPYGVKGGEPGLPGRQRLLRTTDEVVKLSSVDGCDVRPGDRLVLETPGGGGWGKAAEVKSG